MEFIKARLSEPSTWAGLGAVLASLAHALATKEPQAIAGTVAGVVAILMKDGSKPAP